MSARPAEAWLAARLVALAERHPEVLPTVVTTDGAIAVNHADVVIASGAAVADELARGATLLPALPHQLVASPRYVAARGSPSHPDGFRDHVALVHAEDLSGWVLTRAAPETSVVALPRARWTTDVLSQLVAGALAGIGIARLPEALAATALADGRLVAVLPEWTCRAEPMSLRVIAERPTSRVRALVDALLTRG